MNTDRIKHKLQQHWYDYREYYIGTVLTITVAGITTVIMRDRISRAVGVTAERAVGVPGKNHLSNFGNQKSIFGSQTINLTQVIESHRKGAPSWVVRCLETGVIFSSQRSAALEMSLSAAHLSNHLNGTMDHVNGFHFERICMAA